MCISRLSSFVSHRWGAAKGLFAPASTGERSKHQKTVRSLRSDFPVPFLLTQARLKFLSRSQSSLSKPTERAAEGLGLLELRTLRAEADSQRRSCAQPRVLLTPQLPSSACLAPSTKLGWSIRIHSRIRKLKGCVHTWGVLSHIGPIETSQAVQHIIYVAVRATARP